MVPRRVTGDKKMTNTNDLRTRLLAAAFAVAVSAVFFATAIVPASPNGLVIA